MQRGTGFGKTEPSDNEGPTADPERTNAGARSGKQATTAHLVNDNHAQLRQGNRAIGHIAINAPAGVTSQIVSGGPSGVIDAPVKGRAFSSIASNTAVVSKGLSLGAHGDVTSFRRSLTL